MATEASATNARVTIDPRVLPDAAARSTDTTHDAKKRAAAELRKRQRAAQARRAEIDKLEAQIAECEAAIEQTMAAAGFYEDRAAAQPVIDRHQALMWQVGDLMHRWEQLQSAADLAARA